MYPFLKTHFSFLMCFLVILMGCAKRKVSREFSETMKDGRRVVIKIMYKPKSFINSKGEKVGRYYYIAKHFFGNREKGVIFISFYDPEGHLLLRNFDPNGYTRSFSNNEENTFDGGVEWKGQFDESILTVDNFRDIHSITVQWASWY